MLPAEWLRAFAPVGVFKGGNDFVAAGASVFFHHAELLWIITANHVLKMTGERDFSVLVGQATNDHPTVIRLGDLQGPLGVTWIIDTTNDLAASLMPYSPEVNIKAVMAENCLKVDDLVPSMPCYTIGCPYGFRGVDPQSSIPLVLDGIISGVNRSKREIYTSAATFCGNSGGPLIAIRSPYNAAGGMQVGQPTVFLAGIMLKAATVSPQTPQGKLPNLHLGVAKSTDAVFELLKSEQAQAQVKVALATKK